jgi:hypothetical protein
MCISRLPAGQHYAWLLHVCGRVWSGSVGQGHLQPHGEDTGVAHTRQPHGAAQLQLVGWMNCLLILYRDLRSYLIGSHSIVFASIG